MIKSEYNDPSSSAGNCFERPKVKPLELWRKIGQIQLNLENVGLYDLKATLQESHIVTILQYTKVIKMQFD